MGPIEYADIGDGLPLLTIHGAGMNMMDRPRWGYLLVVQPADVCWNGSPCPNFDTSEMVPWQALDDERFPLIG